jgi:hypothetical protein
MFWLCSERICVIIQRIRALVRYERSGELMLEAIQPAFRADWPAGRRRTMHAGQNQQPRRTARVAKHGTRTNALWGRSAALS